MSFDFSQMIMDHTLRALEKGVTKVPQGPQQPMSRYPDLVEGPSPHDGTRTAGAVDPNYCRICTPKGYGCCRCDIACNE